jgi:polyhydroxyalkanoate synthase
MALDRSSQEVGARAAVALETGEDTGFRLSDAFATYLRAMRPLKVAAEFANFSRESLRILAGLSDLKPDPKDWRFKDSAWTESGIYRRIGQTYIAASRSLENLIDGEADWRTREREKLAVEIITSTLSPTNTLLGNPEALKRAFDTGGRSVVTGLRALVHDVQHNGGMPAQVDARHFEVGRNLAATEGSVVFRNDVLEILQYRPRTERVYSRPTLLVTPQINKFYFLDLSPGRSFVEYSVSQGVPTFMVSWRNPGVEQRHWDLDTYIGALVEAIAAVKYITGSKQVNAFGFCAGGITLAALAGYFATRRDNPIATLSFAVTLLDWSTPALIGVLKAGPVLRLAKARSTKSGLHRGKDLRRLFSWLRPNDLVWNYWVNNYLLGKPPPSFDILAWNADSTNLPGALHVNFLEMFEQNPLAQAGALKALGKPVDLGRIKCDAFVTGAINDHLTPWHGCYRTTQLLGGHSTFVLSNAGHIASLVNPPGNPKATYMTGPPPGPDSEAWLAKAKSHQGSWWTAWANWVSSRSGKQVPAPKALGSKRFPPLESAPGLYVHARID